MIPVLGLVLLGALQTPPAQETIASGNVLVAVPEGWKFEQKEEGLFLRPADLAQDEAFVVILPPGQKSEGPLAEGFAQSWKQVVGQRKVISKAPERELKTDGGINGMMSVGLLETALGERLITAVAVFKPGDRAQTVLALTGQDGVFQRYSESLASLLKGLRFRNVELPTYELLASFGSGPGGGGPVCHVLFKDGSWLAALPAEGLDGFDVALGRKRFSGAWGTQETREGVIRLRRGEGVETLQAQPDGSYRSSDGPPFLRIAPSTGLRLEGRFVCVAPAGVADPPRVDFKADGSFEHQGAGAAFLFPDPDRSPEDRTGRYEIANNTLWLQYRKGGVRRISILALPKAGFDTPDVLYLGGQPLRRP
jgi:hypothetical protein